MFGEIISIMYEEHIDALRLNLKEANVKLSIHLI